MKKLIVFLAALTVCLACTGCSDEDSSSAEKEAAVKTDVTTQVTTAAVITAKPKTTTAAASKTTATEKTTVKTTKATEAVKETKAAETEPEPETEPETEAPAEAGGYFEPSDAYVYYGGSSFTINQDASTMPAAQSVDSSPSCYYEGDDKIFHYGAIDVNTYPVNGADYISEIDIISSGASTAKGLTVGMSINDAVSMYGEGSGGSGYYTWSSGGISMYISESGGTITSIAVSLG